MSTPQIAVDPTELEDVPRKPLLVRTWNMAKAHPLGAAGALVVILMIIAAVFAPWITPYDPEENSFEYMLSAPGAQFWLGTDQFGRDILTRIIYGARTALFVGFTCAFIGSFVGLVLGVGSAYFGGKFDMLVQRFVDAWMTFPDLVLLIVVVSIVGPGVPQIIIILGFLYGIAGSRIVRGQVVTVRETMYTHAAQSMGASNTRILFRHILPNVMPVVIVLFTTRVGATILAEAGLSFLGLGVPPPAPTWSRPPG